MSPFRPNPILETDSYKAGHFDQYPPGARHITSYLTARRGPFRDVQFFGLQAVLVDHFLDPVTHADVDEADEFLTSHGEPFNRYGTEDMAGWETLVSRHGGRLPIEIKAVPEGSHVAYGDPLVMVRNTDPEFAWLTSYVETKLMRVWYPTTVSTLSRSMRTIIDQYVAITSDLPFLAGYRLHDFGARGASSAETAYLGGMGHLVNFQGSDTLEAVQAARVYYMEKMAAHSVIATEHSTMTAWGEDGELAAFRNVIRTHGQPGAILSIVSDSWDIRRVLETYLPQLKDEIIASGATIVVRLDSGDPVDQVVTALGIIEKNFGATKNSKGFKVLDHNMRLLQGDGINDEIVQTILTVMTNAGYSIDNIVFGMGGALLQKVNRDTMSFAYKACAVEFEGGEVRQIHKRSEDTWKASKTLAELDTSGMQTVYKDGDLLKIWTFDEVRERAAAGAA